MSNNKFVSKLIASSLLIAGVVGLAPQAQAEDFNFAGEVLTACSFGTINSGALTPNSTNRDFITNTSSTSTITCNKIGATVQIDSIVQGTNPATITSNLNTRLVAQADLSGATTATLNATGTTGSASQVLTTGDTNVAVNLNADLQEHAVLPAGNYSYTVVMTVTP